MNDENKKAAPVLQHQDGSGEQIALPGFTLSKSKHNTGGAEKQSFIAALLSSGSERAVSLRRLSEIAGLSERDTRRAIQRERLRGAPICSDNLKGYFLAADAAERERFVKSMRRRAHQILRAARAVEKGCCDIGPKEQS